MKPALGEQARRILDLEARPWRFAGAKESAIRRELAMTPARYYQHLNALLDDPAAAAYAPMLVSRLRRIRAARRARLLRSQGEATGEIV